MDAGSNDEMLRAARNQSLYREVNERIEELNQRFDAALSAGGQVGFASVLTRSAASPWS
jgi:hypothetical protein